MSSDEDLAALVTELVRALRELQSELSEGRGPPARPPTPRDLLRATSEVAIPATILVLETNVRALRLLQRAIRLADRERDVDAAERPVSDRAVAATDRTLSRLDDALDTLATALDGRPDDEAARELLEEARRLRSEVQRRLDDAAGHTGWESSEAQADDSADGHETADDQQGPDSEHVEVDVEAELDAIKSELDDREGEEDGPPENGRDSGAASTEDPADRRRANADADQNDGSSNDDHDRGDGDDASADGGEPPADDADSPSGGK